MAIRCSGSTFVLTAVLLAALAPLGCIGDLTVGPSGKGGDPVVVLAAVDGQGSAAISPSGDVTVATVGTWTVTFEAGSGGIGGGGAVRFTVPGLWSPPSTSPWAMGYVTVASSSEDVMLDVQVENNVPDPAETHVDAMGDQVTVELAAGILAQGDTVTLTYGDTTGGGEGARAPFGALEGMSFRVETDAQGDGTFQALAASPTVDVVPGPPVALRVVATRTLITAGEDAELDIQVVDQFGNKTTGFGGNLDLDVAQESTAPTAATPSLSLQANDDGATASVTTTDQGFLWFDVSDPSGSLTGDTSNPVMVREAPVLGPPDTYDPPAVLHDFWGDLHAHSGISHNLDAEFTPAYIYEFMIDDANLKFGAVTDYDGPNDINAPRDWNKLKLAANNYNCEPPTDPDDCFDDKHFVTFLGFERNTPDQAYGHMNAYFFQKDGSDIDYDLSDGDEPIPFYPRTQQQYQTPCGFWAAYDAVTVTGFDFITVPHHPASSDPIPPRHEFADCPENCSPSLDEAYQPLVEGFSRHGNSMWSSQSMDTGDDQIFPDDDPISCREDDQDDRAVQSALDPGNYAGCDHRLGIIASGDSHDARPGLPFQGAGKFEVCGGGDFPRRSGGYWDALWYRAPRKGLLCAYSQAATSHLAFHREKILDALKARRTYATTGARIGLWFEIDADDGQDTTTIYLGQEHDDADETYEAHIQAAADGESIRYWRLLRYDPSAAEWTVCKEVGPLVNKYSVNAAVDLDAQSPSCIEEGLNIYYVEIEQALAIEDKFLLHDHNCYIDFKIDGETYAASIDRWPGVKWYTAAGLATAIAEAMNDEYGQDEPFAALYSTGSQKFKIWNTNEDNFKILWSSGDHAVGDEPSSANVLLGFDGDNEGSDYYWSDNANYSDGWSDREMAWSSPIWITVEE